ncbi:MAG TPA: DUF6714 family protein, partial [Capsulimonadaceae bacterium]|nr:DUF6714 family protein [Capsulimonadaceae bacterium]
MADRLPLNKDDKQRVRDQIVSAFEGVPMPEFEEIIAQPSTGDLAEKKIQKEIAGSTWDSLSVDFLKRLGSAFYYLSPQAFQYYLPSLLVAGIDQEDPDLFFAGVGDLTPSPFLTYYEGSDERFDSQVSLFTPDQEMAVVAFLGLFIDVDQPDERSFQTGFAF